MKQIAQLLKANLGVEAAFTDVSGWDTHQNQGSVNGQLANRLGDFSASIAAFWRDLGDDADNVTLVTMSEFGRTARENGTGGTDHGHANAMFVLGGEVKGGKVYGRWPGLDNDQLNEGRDLVLTTDFRNVLGEVVSQTLGATNMESVFPGAQLAPRPLPPHRFSCSGGAPRSVLARTSPSHPCADPCGWTRACRTCGRPDTHARPRASGRPSPASGPRSEPIP